MMRSMSAVLGLACLLLMGGCTEEIDRSPMPVVVGGGGDVPPPGNPNAPCEETCFDYGGGIVECGCEAMQPDLGPPIDVGDPYQ